MTLSEIILYGGLLVALIVFLFSYAPLIIHGEDIHKRDD